MAKAKSLQKLKESLKERGAIKPNTKKSKVAKSESKKAAPQSKEVNPFELKFTRVKHNVIGRKVKGVNGNPALSKKRSHEVVSLVCLPS